MRHSLSSAVFSSVFSAALVPGASSGHICRNLCRKTQDTEFIQGFASAAGCRSLLGSNMCVWEGCVLADGLFPSSLLVASLISAITIWKQLVLGGRMPSAPHEAAWREILVLHTGRTDAGRSGEGGSLVWGRLWIRLWKCKPSH